MKRSRNLNEIFQLDKYDYIYFNRFEDIDIRNMPKVIVYKDELVYKIVPIKRNNAIVGRRSKITTPSIDLTDLDEERLLSKRHIQIFKEAGEFYVKNVSENGIVKVADELVPVDGMKKIEPGDRVTLSDKYVLEFIGSRI